MVVTDFKETKLPSFKNNPPLPTNIVCFVPVNGG